MHFVESGSAFEVELEQAPVLTGHDVLAPAQHAVGRAPRPAFDLSIHDYFGTPTCAPAEDHDRLAGGI